MSNRKARDYWRQSGGEAFGSHLAKDPDLQALNEAEIAEIEQHLPDLHGLQVLDLGAGIGRFTGHLAARAAQVTAVDLSPDAIAENRARHAHYDNIDYRVADVAEHDFGAERFDLVFANWLLMYLDDSDLEQVLARVARCLKPGGQWFVRESCRAAGTTGWRVWLRRPSGTFVLPVKRAAGDSSWWRRLAGMRPWRQPIQTYRPVADYEHRLARHFSVRQSGHLASYEAAFDTLQQHYWLVVKPERPDETAASVGDGIQARPKAWSFSGDTWQTFDDHIRRSIPFYDQLHELIVGYAQEFASPDGWLYELGCSTGTLSRRLSQACPDSRVCGIDAEPAMVAKAQTVRRANLEYHCLDIRTFDFADTALHTDLVVLCYTLQFIPVSDRLPLLRRIHAALRPGGALVLAEKVKRRDVEFHDLCRRVHHNFKRSQGYTDAEIDAKDRSLEGILVPLYEEENIGLLHQAGFRLVNSVFHNTAFEAWLAVK